MQTPVKFIFTCIISVILAVPLLYKNISAAHEENTAHSAKSTEHGKEAAENVKKSAIEKHGEEVTAQGESISHGEEHGSSKIWPHYGKMAIFAKLLLAFMVFSFVAPLIHFYTKGSHH